MKIFLTFATRIIINPNISKDCILINPSSLERQTITDFHPENSFQKINATHIHQNGYVKNNTGKHAGISTDNLEAIQYFYPEIAIRT